MKYPTKFSLQEDDCDEALKYLMLTLIEDGVRNSLDFLSLFLFLFLLSLSLSSPVPSGCYNYFTRFYYKGQCSFLFGCDLCSDSLLLVRTGCPFFAYNHSDWTPHSAVMHDYITISANKTHTKHPSAISPNAWISRLTGV